MEHENYPEQNMSEIIFLESIEFELLLENITANALGISEENGLKFI